MFLSAGSSISDASTAAIGAIGAIGSHLMGTAIWGSGPARRGCRGADGALTLQEHSRTGEDSSSSVTLAGCHQGHGHVYRMHDYKTFLSVWGSTG